MRGLKQHKVFRMKRLSSLPAAQKGMEKAAAAMLPAARAEAVQTAMPEFQATAKPAAPSFWASKKGSGGMSTCTYFRV